MGQRHRFLLSDHPTPRRLTPSTGPRPPRQPRPDPRNHATRKSWHRPADHARATTPHPAALQGNRVDDHEKSPIHGLGLSVTAYRCDAGTYIGRRCKRGHAEFQRRRLSRHLWSECISLSRTGRSWTCDHLTPSRTSGEFHCLAMTLTGLRPAQTVSCCLRSTPPIRT